MRRSLTDSRPSKPDTSNQEWFDVRDLAKRYKCSVRHVLRLAERGDLPPGTKLGALRRWSRSSIEAAEAAR